MSPTTTHKQIPLREIKCEVPLTFDLFLYFQKSGQFVIFHKKKETLTADMITRYEARGLKEVWYQIQDETLLKTHQETPVPEKPKEEFKTESGKKLVEAIRAQDKPAVIAEAKKVIEEAAQATTPQEQKQADKQVELTVMDILSATAIAAESAVGEIWKICQVEPETEHSVQVASYAVVFGMAFGKIESDLLSDIAQASLMHDVGLSQIPARLTRVHQSQLSKDDRPLYAEHVPETIRLLKEHSPESCNERVQILIEQHHERFDGTGFPKAIQGFEFNDVSQLIALAELIESLMKGHWDGKTRILKEALEWVGHTAQDKTSPQFFNPDLLAAVLDWLASASPEASAQSPAAKAAQLIQGKTQDLLKRPAA